MAGMDAAGLLMGPYPTLPHFRTFIWFFAAPWAAWLVLLYLTASPARIFYHRLLANTTVKGCLAVPLSRLGGSLLQHAGWPESDGYYIGIGAATLGVGLWVVADILLMLREPSSSAAASSSSKVK